MKQGQGQGKARRRLHAGLHAAWGVGLVLATLATGLVPAGPVAAQAYQIAPAASVSGQALPLHVGGRVLQVGEGDQRVYRSQWPGTYYETAFHGRAVFFRWGQGEVRLRVTVDDQPTVLIRPAAGLYRIGGLSDGDHRLRLQVISENQAAPVDFGGVFGVPPQAPGVAPRDLQIEFVGDSYTVGYGNTSPDRTCSTDRVWETTDTAAGIPGQLSRRLDADYQVNAISGRGVIRNYDGAMVDTLPQAYDFTLFDSQVWSADAGWHPGVIVIALGTNDFSTPLKDGERWAGREQLISDFEAAYAGFLRGLALRNPGASLLVWGLEGSEAATSSQRVVDRLRAAGNPRVRFVTVAGLSLDACLWHPGVADGSIVAEALAAAIDDDAADRSQTPHIVGDSD